MLPPFPNPTLNGISDWALKLGSGSLSIVARFSTVIAVVGVILTIIVAASAAGIIGAAFSFSPLVVGGALGAFLAYKEQIYLDSQWVQKHRTPCAQAAFALADHLAEWRPIIATLTGIMRKKDLPEPHQYLPASISPFPPYHFEALTHSLHDQHRRLFGDEREGWSDRWIDMIPKNLLQLLEEKERKVHTQLSCWRAFEIRCQRSSLETEEKEHPEQYQDFYKNTFSISLIPLNLDAEKKTLIENSPFA